VFIIGIDPHKGSHTAAVIDGDEQVVGIARHAERQIGDHRRPRSLHVCLPMTWVDVLSSDTLVRARLAR
jgi:hypothetical protein